jgi:hypothetical protein
MSSDNKNNNGDDDLDDDNVGGPDSPPWFQQPAPSVRVTFTVAALVLVWVVYQHHQRVQQLKIKFGIGSGSSSTPFRGALRYSAIISAYVDNDDPTFAIARLVGKSTVFLGLMQLNFIRGFWIMMGLLVLESSLDTVRILLAYGSCHSLRQLRATTASSDEAKDLDETTQLEPNNVYEDLARPMPISIMVFSVQTLLIGCVMYDTLSTTTRTCFNGNPLDACPMLESMGSYCLYYLGTFMACVFYVGPMNSYGKKEHDPVFWLKLFVLSKQPDPSSVVQLTWQHPVLTERTMCMQLQRNDIRIWTRFLMSLLINSVCFHFLLNVLPVQIASKSSIMGIVFSSVGMIYLVDLDDTSGQPLSVVVVAAPTTTTTTTTTAESSSRAINNNNNNNGSYDSILPADGTTTTTTTTTDSNNVNLEAVKQRLIEQALQEIRARLEVELAVSSGGGRSGGLLVRNSSTTSTSSTKKVEGITHALFLSATSLHNSSNSQNENDNVGGEETTPLIV